MGSVFSSLRNATGTLDAFSNAFSVVQNNIANANTPGYVKQDQVMLALPFNPAAGLAGGVMAGPLGSSRSEFLEQAVRNQQEYFGLARQKAADLSYVESLFDLRSEFGVPGALNAFFNGFSELAVNPNDPVARQGVLDLAGTVAAAFGQTALGLKQVSANVDSQTRDVVTSINRLASEIADVNRHFRASAGAARDAGLDARLYASLEELSEYANYSLIRTPDGAANVFLGGQTLLVIGDTSFEIQADLSGLQTAIRDRDGKDVSAQITRGALGGLLEEKNVIIPGYAADLDTTAAAFADAVNLTFTAGVDRNGNPGTALFNYNAANGAAFTLGVNPLGPDEIAAASAAAPGGNGNAIAVAQLANTPLVNGFSITQYFGNLGARVGRDVSTARQQHQRFTDSVTQARAQRGAVSEVSLDEEAARLMQFQLAYQAVGKLIGVLNDLTSTVVNLIR